MTDIDIDAIRQREQAASPGPWIADEWEIYSDPTRAWIAETLDTDDPARSRADAEFIAHARTDVPALLAKVAELTAELEQWRATYGEDALRNAQRILTERAELAAALTQSRQQASTYANEIGALKADLERTRAELATADIVIASMRAAIDEDEAVAR